MKAHINTQKTAEQIAHEEAVKLDAEKYFESLIANQYTDAQRVKCETNQEYDAKINEAFHVTDVVDETKFPPYDPTGGMSFDEYIETMAEDAASDQAIIQRYGVDGKTITEMISRPDKDDCPFDLDDDTGMVSSSNLSPSQQAELGMGNNGTFDNKAYIERRNKEMADFGLQSGLFNSNAVQLGVPQQPTTFGNNSMYQMSGPSVGYSIDRQFEVKDGIKVRVMSPYFTINPMGNKWRDMFFRVYNFPNHPKYEEIKNNYHDEEYSYINGMIKISRLARPANVSKEDWDKEMRKIYDPYSVEAGIPINNENTNTNNNAPVHESPYTKMVICRKGDVVLKGEGPSGTYKLDAAFFERINNEERIRNAKAYASVQEAYNRYLGAMRHSQIMAEKFPDMHTVSTEDFWSGKSDLSDRIWDYLVVQPELRARKYNTIGASYNQYDYLCQLGATYDYRMRTHTTAGEDIIRKCGLKPGDPLYEYYKREADHANWVAMTCFNGDGTLKRDAEYDIRKQAYDLAIEYRKDGTLEPGKPAHNVPNYIAETLPKEVQIELGYTKEV